MIVLYNQLELMNDLSMDLQSSLNYVLEKGARACRLCYSSHEW